MKKVFLLLVLALPFMVACSDDDDDNGADRTTGTSKNHEWVDLGLSVKWATCNVGASSPDDYGDYYAWGETSTKSSYTEENSVTYGKNMGSIAGNSTYDAARANWGGTWRMPTDEEIEELASECKWERMVQGEHVGYKVTGPNGNSIFIPAAGYRNGASLFYAEELGLYWSATPYGDYNAYDLYFNNGPTKGGVNRGRGQSIRPVME